MNCSKILRQICKLCLALLFFTFTSCNVEQSVNKPLGINLKTYFDSEIALLNTKNAELNKTIIYGEDVFTNKTEKPNWEKELAIFKQYGIIKSSQLDLYDNDTFKMDNGSYFISYRANDIKPALKLLETQYNKDNSIEKITLIVQADNKISNHDINMTYLPQKGYDIKGVIESKVSKQILLDIHGEVVH